MFYIIDLRQDPPERVPGVSFETNEECCEWIDENGDACTYSIIEE